MRIGSIVNNASFGRIKFGYDVECDLENNSSSSAINNLRDMSLKGKDAYLEYDGEYDSYYLSAFDPRKGEIRLSVGSNVTAEDVRNRINSYNRLYG